MKNLMIVACLLFFAVPTAHAAWEYNEEKDPFTDEDNSFVSSLSLRDSGMMAFKCLGDKIHVMFVSELRFTDDGQVAFWRVDNNKVSVKVLDNTDNPIVVALGKDFKEKALVEATAGRRLHIRIFKDNEQYTTLEFDLIGLTRALSNLSCF